MQPLKVWQGLKGTGPNPWKVILVLAVLEIPYEIQWYTYLDAKKEPYLSLNPNGRFPAMLDPNNGITLFESGAIINYIIDTYDTERKLCYEDQQLKYLTQSWLMMQMSGQGPQFGQRMWFVHFHVENISTALDRYGNEVKRIIGVINSSLRKQREALHIKDDEPVWLVGDKCTYADLSFVPWNVVMFASLFPGEEDEFRDWLAKECPQWLAWHESMANMPRVKETLEARAEFARTLDDSAPSLLDWHQYSKGAQAAQG